MICLGGSGVAVAVGAFVLVGATVGVGVAVGVDVGVFVAVALGTTVAVGIDICVGVFGDTVFSVEGWGVAAIADVGTSVGGGKAGFTNAVSTSPAGADAQDTATITRATRASMLRVMIAPLAWKSVICAAERA